MNARDEMDVNPGSAFENEKGDPSDCRAARLAFGS
jgi:hypothetical protein